MKKREIYGCAFLLIFLSMVMGCADEKELYVSSAGYPIEFAIHFKSDQPKTRSTLDNEWPLNTEISISNGTDVYIYKTGETVSDPAGSYALSPKTYTFYWPVNHSSMSFEAWYPVASVKQAGITVAENQTVYNETTNPSGITDATYLGYDLLYCPEHEFAYLSNVPLEFFHQMSHVIVLVNTSATEGHDEIVESETVRVKEKVEGISFGGGRLGLTGTISTYCTYGAANGSTIWSTPTQSKSIAMRPLTERTNASNNIYAFECILPPQSNATEAGLITITTSGALNNEGTAQIERTYTYNADFTLQSGYEYTYDLAISEQGTITIDKVKVDPWNATVQNVNNTATIPNNSYPN